MRVHLVGFCLSLLVVLSAAYASDPPDSELNPVTGHTESVDLATDSTNRVRHTIDKGQTGRTATLISSAGGSNPRIAITSNGHSWVTWWKDAATDEIYAAVHNVQTGTWTAETVVSLTGENSRAPEIVPSGSVAWIAFEIPSGSTTSVATVAIADDADPIGPRTILGTASYAGDVDVLVHAESGKVWVTWVDSSTLVGWSKYNAGTATWDLPLYESYSGSTIPAARAAVRATVLGN